MTTPEIIAKAREIQPIDYAAQRRRRAATLAGLWRKISETWATHALRAKECEDEAAGYGWQHIVIQMQNTRAMAERNAERALDKALELERGAK